MPILEEGKTVTKPPRTKPNNSNTIFKQQDGKPVTPPPKPAQKPNSGKENQ